MSMSNNKVHIDEVNESVAEKVENHAISLFFCLFRIKQVLQVCIIVTNE